MLLFVAQVNCVLKGDVNNQHALSFLYLSHLRRQQMNTNRNVNMSPQQRQMQYEQMRMEQLKHQQSWQQVQQDLSRQSQFSHSHPPSRHNIQRPPFPHPFDPNK